MIYLLGGAPRTGKSLLARRINQRRGVYIVSTDLLRGVLMMLDEELKEAMIAAEPVKESELFYVHLRQAIACLRLQEPDALIEGVGFLPRHVPQLERELDIEIRSCFLGNTAATVERLFGHPTDHRYYDDFSDKRKEASVRRVIAWSELLADDCQQHGQPFVDMGAATFEESMDAAEDALFGAR